MLVQLARASALEIPFGRSPWLVRAIVATVVLASALGALPAAAWAQAAAPPPTAIVGASVVNLNGGPARGECGRHHRRAIASPPSVRPRPRRFRRAPT